MRKNFGQNMFFFDFFFENFWVQVERELNSKTFGPDKNFKFFYGAKFLMINLTKQSKNIFFISDTDSSLETEYQSVRIVIIRLKFEIGRAFG